MTDTSLVERLRGLIERLEKLEGPDRELDLVLAQTLVPDVIVLQHDPDTRTNVPHTYWEYTASLDAAVALVERLGLQWLRKSLNTMTVFRMPSDDKTWATHFEETGATPAIALLIATLKALEQQND